MNADDWGLLVTAVIGGGGLGGALTAWFKRPESDANAVATQATARATDVDTLRDIIAELRQSEAIKDKRIERIEARLSKVEERERHMLTRAAVHEAWDQLAFQALIINNPNHPPPPPLVDRNEITGRGEEKR